MKISLGADHSGVELGKVLIEFIQKNFVAEITNHGTFSGAGVVDYPDYAQLVASDVASSRSKFGILICRSGIGMCIAANKMQNVRAANCNSTTVARLAREHNDINILCFGVDFVSMDDAKNIVHAFLSTKFAGGRHLERLEKIINLENS